MEAQETFFSKEPTYRTEVSHIVAFKVESSRRALKLEKSLGSRNMGVEGRNRGAFNFTPPVQNKIEDR